MTREDRLIKEAIQVVAVRRRLGDSDVKALHRYFRGGRTCEDYDLLDSWTKSLVQDVYVVLDK